MSHSTLFHQWKNRRHHHSRREAQQRFFRPLVERLEPRLVLSVSAAITGSAPDRVLQIDGDAGDQDLRIALDAGQTNLLVSNHGSSVGTFAVADFDTASVRGLGGDDSLTVVLSGGSPVPGGITYDGGAGGFDVLTLEGAADSIQHTGQNPNDGSLLVDGSPIEYIGLEPINISGTVTDLTLTFFGGPETIILSDDGNPGNGITRIDSDLGELVDFVNPTNSLQIELRLTVGADTLNVEGLDPTFSADLKISADDDDIVNFQNNPTNLNGGDLEVLFPLTINVSQPISTTLDGGVQLNATGNLQMTSPGAVNTEDGTIQLTGTGSTVSGVEVDSTVVQSATGNIIMSGTGTDHGVLLHGTQVTTSGNVSLLGNGGGAGHGVRVEADSSVVTTGAGTILLVGQGGSSSSSHGIAIHGSRLEAADGDITVNGQGSATPFAAATNQFGVLLDGATEIRSTGAANINVTGVGGFGATSGNTGLAALGSSVVEASGSGNISLTGAGGSAGTDVNEGVSLQGATINSSNSGSITITGTGGGTASDNHGVLIGNSQVTSSGSGAVTIDGTGSPDGTDANRGVGIFGGTVVSSAFAGNISITGTAGGLGQSNIGVLIDGSQVSSTGVGANAAEISITGTGDADAGPDNAGVLIGTLGTTVSTIDGNITLSGTGGGQGGSGSLSAAVGIAIGAVVESTGTGGDAGTITLTSLGGVSDRGVRISDINTMVTSVDGDIVIDGSTPGGDQHGVAIESGATVTSTGDGLNAANITILGSGADGDGDDYGVIITDSGSRVTSRDGNISIFGTGGGGTNGNKIGVVVRDAGDVQATTGGGIEIIATGGPGTAGGNSGIVLDTQAVVGTQGGPITLTGIATNAGVGLSDNIGVSLDNGSIIFSSSPGGPGSLPVTVNGTGAGDLDPMSTNNHGVVFGIDNAGVASSGGDIMIEGTGGDSGGGASDGVLLQAGSQVQAQQTVATDITGGAVSGNGISAHSLVNSNTGTLSITSLDNILLGPLAMIQSADNTVTITGDSGPGDNGSSITMADGSAIESVNGQVSVTTDGDILLSSVIVTSLATVSVTSDSGAIIDNTASEVPNVDAETVAFQAAAGIGTPGAGDIDTASGQLAAANTTSGSIVVDNDIGDGPLFIGTVDSVVGVLNNATGGAIDIDASSTLLVNNNILAADGDVTITTEEGNPAGDFDDLTVSPGVRIEATAGNVTLNTADDLHLPSGSTVAAPAGTITIVVDDPAADPDGGPSIVGSIVDVGDANVLNSAAGTSITTGDDDDIFNITGQVNSALFVDGNPPDTGGIPPGDTLNYFGPGTNNVSAPGQGTITAPGVQDVDYVSIEDLPGLPTPLVLSVDIPIDELDGDRGPGDLSLREAIEEANANPGSTIQFDPILNGSTIVVDIALGELSIDQDTTILGPGPENLTIDALHERTRIFAINGVTVEISGLTLTGANQPLCTCDGGAIINFGGNLTVSNMWINDNLALRGPGIWSNGTLTVDSTTISNNESFVSAGGIYVTGGVATITNSTISGNRSNGSSSGGGVHVLSGATATILNSTIAGNHATNQGGGIRNRGTVNLGNTIVADNTADFGGPDVFGTINSLGFNLISDTTDTSGFVASDLLDVGAGLAPLADNGGSTPTHALNPGSVAVDAGLDAAGSGVDQRGDVRPFEQLAISNAAGGDGSDIGAHEARFIEVDLINPTAALIQLVGGPLGPTPTPFILRGDATAHVLFDGLNEGDADDDDGNALGEVQTELVSLNLTGGGVTLSINPAQPSLGQIEELVNNVDDRLELSPFTVTGSGVFVDSNQLLGSGGGRELDLGDLDGDGDLDIFAVNEGGPNAVLFNDGSGNFTDSGQALGNSVTRTVDLGDVDGDGDLDAFTANDNQPNVVWINDGTGVFTDSGQQLGLVDSVSVDVELADLDGDSDLDAYVVNGGARRDRVYLNDGSGNFTDSGQVFQAEPGSGVALGDVDGDADMDAFVGGAAPHFLYLNDGNGNLTDSGHAFGGSDVADGLFEDLDADGDLDLLILSSAGNPSEVWFNDGSGNFTNSGQSLANETFDAALADIDGDGDKDVFFARRSTQSGPNQVFLNDGTGFFSDSGQSIGNFRTFGVRLGDVDGDGDPDAVTSNIGGQDNRVWLNEDSVVHSGRADSFFDVFFQLDVGGGLVLHNNDPLRLQAIIAEKPPIASYQHILPPGGLELFDDNDNPTGIFITKAAHYTGDIEVDVIQQTGAKFTLVGGPIGPDPQGFRLSGDSTVHVFFERAEGDALDNDGNGLDEVQTELVELNLTGGGISVSLNPNIRSLGQIEELLNNTPDLLDLDPFAPGDADSFFDVFFQIDVGGGLILHNDQALRIETVIGEKPPLGSRYVHILPPTGPLELLDQNDNPSGIFLVEAQHTTGFVEVDTIQQTGAKFTLVGGPIGPDPQGFRLSGSSEVEVFFEGAEGDADDDDGNNREEVETELVELNLSGGGISVSLNPNVRSFGSIEELINNTIGRLDLDPFHPGDADSFFDVFFQIDVGGGLILHNDQALRIETVIGEKPPLGSRYVHILPPTGPLELLDQNDNPSGIFLVDAQHTTGFVEVDTIQQTGAKFTLVGGPIGPDPQGFRLSGSSEVEVFFEGAEGDADDDDGNNREEVETELVELNLSGGGISVSLNPNVRSFGSIEELVNNTIGRLDLDPFHPGDADSFFDVFFQIDVGGGLILHNNQALRIETVIGEKPPLGARYIHILPPTGPLELLDQNDNPTGIFLVDAQHTTGFVEVDTIQQTGAKFTLVGGPIGPDPQGFRLAGSSEVEVFFEGAEGDADDDDGNNREEVETELVELNLSGGGISVSLNPNVRSFGSIEELVNNTIGRLDLDPFHPGDADSFFDVFFQIDVGGGLILHNDQALRIETVIGEKPPLGSRYVHILPPTGPLELLDQNDNPSGIFLVDAQHTTGFVEVDTIQQTGAKFTLVGGPIGPDPQGFRLAGSSEVEVFFEGAEGDADDDDGNNREEVETELVELNLSGGGISVSLNPNVRSFGSIEELVNNTIGRLDLDPFHPGDADSFFDVFFQIDVGGGLILHNDQALRIETVIGEKPPLGSRYVHILPPTGPLELLDQNDNPSGIFLVDAQHTTGFVEVDTIQQTGAKFTLVGGPIGPDPQGFRLSGSSEVEVFFEGAEGDADDDDGNNREEVETELVELNLSGGGISVSLNPNVRSFGSIEELVNNTIGRLDLDPFHPGDADSFFDVFFQIDVGGGLILHNDQAMRIEAIIGEKPPLGARYIHILPPTGPLELLDQNDNPTGIFLVDAEHDTGFVEVDEFEFTLAEIELIPPVGPSERIILSGPATVDVFFEGAEGIADDDDGDGLDDVETEIVSMSLTGNSSLGPVEVRLNPNIPSGGEIEEQVNNTPGLLDVDPFAPGSANSFFDVFFEIEIGGQVFHTIDPKHMRTVITEKPPVSGVYEDRQIIDLFDAAGNPTGFAIGTTRHQPTPGTGSIHGIKFEDVDGDGTYDPLIDERFPGVKIGLFGDTDGDGVSELVLTHTDENGEFWFEDLFPGPFTVTESPPDGSVPTTPTFTDVFVGLGQELVALPGQAMNLEPGQTEVVLGEQLMFGNTYLGSIHGFKYEDIDGNGVYDPLIDVPMPGVWIGLYGDPDNDGTPDLLSGETDENGEYWFTELHPGPYSVAEIPPEGTTPTTPTSTSVFVFSGEELVALPGQSMLGPGQEEVVLGSQLMFGNTREHFVEHDHFDDTEAVLTLDKPDGTSETIILRGPTSIDVWFESQEGQARDHDGNGLDEVMTKMIQLDLTGDSSLGPVHVGLNPNIESTGLIEENVNNNPGRLDLDPFHEGDALSWFDLFLEITVSTPTGDIVLHNNDPKQMHSTITEKPPGPGDTYESPTTIPLFDDQENPSGFALGPARHTPEHFVEHDHFDETEAQIELIGPTGSEIIFLQGPAWIDVWFERQEGLARDDSGPDGMGGPNGFDEVMAKFMGLDLAGDSSLGQVQLSLNPDFVSGGIIEEHQNLLPGTLEVPPFADGTAWSWFDIYFEIDVPGVGLLHNLDPKTMHALLDHKPPGEGVVYEGPDTIQLFDEAGNPTPFSIGPARHVPVHEIEHDHFDNTEAEIELIAPDGSSEIIFLQGPAWIDVWFERLEGRARDDSGPDGMGGPNGFDEVMAKFVGLDLAGDSSLGQVQLTLNPDFVSSGIIEEHQNLLPGTLEVPPFADGTAWSWFDIFFELDVPGVGLLHNLDPKTMHALLDHKPPGEGVVYEGPDTIELFDENGNPTGFLIGPARHVPVHEIEHDHFDETEAQIELIGPTGSEIIFLQGPAWIDVWFEQLEGRARDDSGPDGMGGPNGFDEVMAKFMGLDLAGDSSLGQVQLSLNPDFVSGGIIEEHQNLLPGTLEVPPFADGTAWSWFDIYFEIDVPGVGLLHNLDPKTMHALLDHKPPGEGVVYEGPDTIQLFDEAGNPTPFSIGPARHVPVHEIEHDHFDNTEAEIELIAPDGSSEIIFLQGPASVDVWFERLEGRARDDSGPDPTTAPNGLDEVMTKFVDLQLSGTKLAR